MPQGELKVGQIIEVTYTATKATSGLTDVKMEIYDETGAKDIGTFPDVTMIEIATTGRYKGSFTSDVEGKWRVMIDSATKAGKIEKDFDIVGHNIDEVGDVIVTVDVKADGIKAKTDNLPADPSSETNVSAVGSAVVTVDGKADGIKAKTDNLPADPAGVSDVALYASTLQGVDNDTLKDISDQLDGITGYESPPMIG